MIELQGVAAELGLPRFAAQQMAQWMYQKHVVEVDEMTNLSKAGRLLLKERGYEVGVRAPLTEQRSVDGTVKYLFPTTDRKQVETVLIPDERRFTLCISTQVGCKMNCLFCQTGKQGFHGQLTTGDILAQVSWVMRSVPLTNIVVMGQGEPLDNLDNLLPALDILTAPWGYAWSPTRITVSTVGLSKSLTTFLDHSSCHLAVSLHNPIHEERLDLMPSERQFPIVDIVEQLRSREDFHHQRRLTFEYIVLPGMNDTPRHVTALVHLLRGLPCRVNLIRWHHVPDVPLPATTETAIEALRETLVRKGIRTTIRASRGEDIMAACGLLSTKQRFSALPQE